MKDGSLRNPGAAGAGDHPPFGDKTAQFGHPLRSGEVKKRGDDAISEHCHVKSGFFGALAHA
ncbi:MAG: hypothetical protein ERJ69_04205 [Aphanocapsa feldmannii 288cV]|nr:MAG: hypothetical protein ERJ69_04205 [Aphanocapsa feldmannii 288cV]